MTLGVFIIAKNEADKLNVLLPDLAEISDQIVLVDTGSSDNTYLTASKFGCEVYFFDWEDDFSKVRNFALSHIRTDWVLAIDCDEFIEYEELLKIKNIVDSTDADGVNLKITNNLSNGIKSVHRYTRLFRNFKYFRYSGRVHEQIRKSIEDNKGKIIESEIQIIHNGYFENDRNKQIRNKKLLLLDIKENPNDDWLKYHLANTEFALNSFSEAAKLYNLVINSKDLSEKQKHMSAIRLSQIALVNDEYDIIEKYTAFNSGDKDIEGMRLYILATAKLMMRNYKEAKSLFDRVTEIKSNLVNYNNVIKAMKLIKNILS